MRSVWDHPCDDYYKNMYKEEKQKLAEKKVKDAEKARSEKEAKAERKKKKKEAKAAKEAAAVAQAAGMWLDYKKSVSVKSGQSAAWFGSAHEESDAQKCRDRFEAPQNRHRLA